MFLQDIYIEMYISLLKTITGMEPGKEVSWE